MTEHLHPYMVDAMVTDHRIQLHGNREKIRLLM